jgi:hypothetical protein
MGYQLNPGHINNPISNPQGFENLAGFGLVEL